MTPHSSQVIPLSILPGEHVRQLPLISLHVKHSVQSSQASEEMLVEYLLGGHGKQFLVPRSVYLRCMPRGQVMQLPVVVLQVSHRSQPVQVVVPGEN